MISERIPDVRKIAILRANYVGDYVQSLPALESLRAAYPDAEVVLLGQPWHRELLLGGPGPVDRVEVIPVYRGVREVAGRAEDEREQDAFFTRMQQEKFDLALQLHGGGRHSNPFVLRLGARVTAGMATPDAPVLDRWVRHVYYQRELVRYLEVVGLVGAAPTTIEPHLALIPRDLEEASRLFPQSEAPIVLINPGARDPRRRYPADKFAVIADILARRGAQVIVNCGREERLIAQAVRHGMKMPAILTGDLSLGGLCGLISRCRVVISNDSGPLHLALALQVPTVGIFWCGCLLNAGPTTLAQHRPHGSWRLTCPICNASALESRCDHDASWVADVPPQEILDSALELLEGNYACTP